MRPHSLSTPGEEALLATPLHVLVRDYPEILAVLRAGGVDQRVHGARALGELERGRSLLPALIAITSWRPSGA